MAYIIGFSLAIEKIKELKLNLSFNDNVKLIDIVFELSNDRYKKGMDDAQEIFLKKY
jgi:hypothetical protein